MNRKTLARILLIALILGACALACISGGGGGGIDPANVTATFGAQQFHAQLTAQAQKP